MPNTPALNQYLTQVNNLAALLNRLDQSKAEPTAEFQARACAHVRVRRYAHRQFRRQHADHPRAVSHESHPGKPRRSRELGQQCLSEKWKPEVWETWNTKLAGRYPFVDVADEAALTELVDFLRPSTGLIWKFFDKNLADKLGAYRKQLHAQGIWRSHTVPRRFL